MITFVVSLFILYLGYKIYGSFVDRSFKPDDRRTPAVANNDGVDFVPMKTYKVFLVQLLNIAGLGPIFGAITGALWGPIVFLWIVFGTIFAGAVHDYLSGMLSERNNGASIAEIVGRYLGNTTKQIMRLFSFVLLVMVGVVFMVGPAELIAMLTPETLNVRFWSIVILTYYGIATFLPIDKIISRFYPFFGLSLLVMALLIGGITIFNDIAGVAKIPEIWNYIGNMHYDKVPIWPMMFISVACGAISGFHATQSPLMARCIKSERDGKKVFYGAMCMESVIALVWAGAASAFFYDPTTNGWLAEKIVVLNGKEEIVKFIGNSTSVYNMSISLLGLVGGAFAVIGVILCPITSGDTALRAARLTIADWFKIDQKNAIKRLFLTTTILVIGYTISLCDYSVIWRYFSWSNQTLATIVLWTGGVFLCKNRSKNIGWIAVIPATYMTSVVIAYILQAKEGLNIDPVVSNVIGIVCAVVLLLMYIAKVFLKCDERKGKKSVDKTKENTKGKGEGKVSIKIQKKVGTKKVGTSKNEASSIKAKSSTNIEVNKNVKSTKKSIAKKSKKDVKKTHSKKKDDIKVNIGSKRSRKRKLRKKKAIKAEV